MKITNKVQPFNNKKERRGKPRRNAAPIWRRTYFSSIFVLGLCIIGVSGSWWLSSTGWFAQKTSWLKWELASALSRSGFTLKEILVIGRVETSQSELRKALQVDVGAPLITYDLKAARSRVEALPWVRQATVKRMLPNTILLSIEESRPLAIWQNRGKFYLIDDNGEQIKVKNISKFNTLLVVVGEDAPFKTAQLFSFLETEPELLKMVKAAIWVGGRRWNLKMDGEINVSLPEKEPAKAWARLARYEKNHNILGKNIEGLDLRMSDRLIIRKRDKFGATETLIGQET